MNSISIIVLLLVTYCNCQNYGSQFQPRPPQFQPSFKDNRNPDYYNPEGINRTPSKKTSNRITPISEKFDSYAPVTHFSWNLFKKASSTSDNLVVSPFSIQYLLSILSTAAEGETKNQIIKAISFHRPNQLDQLKNEILSAGTKREFQLASIILKAEDLELSENFQQTVAIDLIIDILSVDFNNPNKVKERFNDFVREKTKNYLSGTLNNFSPSIRMLLTNVIYFKAQWIYEFEPAGPQRFYLPDGRTYDKSFMKLQKKLKYGKLNNNLGQWVELPYDSRSESMLILVPNNGNANHLVNSLDSTTVENLIENTYTDSYANVSLLMPKFTISSTVSLVNVLRDLGITNVFSHNSQLPYISDKENVQISDVQQQSKIEVNEKGTVAASISTFSVVALAYTPPIENVDVVVNRPFVAMVIDKNHHVPLFIAKINVPE